MTLCWASLLYPLSTHKVESGTAYPYKAAFLHATVDLFLRGQVSQTGLTCTPPGNFGRERDQTLLMAESTPLTLSTTRVPDFNIWTTKFKGASTQEREES